MTRQLVLLTILTSCAWPAHAQPDTLAGCRKLADAASRLACYDAIPLPTVAPAQAGPAPAAAAPATKAAPAVADAADFGLEKRKAQAVVEGVDSVIPGPFDGWGPKTVWRLANGQTWRVVDGSRGVYSLRDPAVHIRRGLVGNYVMEIQGVAQLIKVRRIE